MLLGVVGHRLIDFSSFTSSTAQQKTGRPDRALKMEKIHIKGPGMYKNMVEKSGNLKTRDQSSKNCIFFWNF